MECRDEQAQRGKEWSSCLLGADLNTGIINVVERKAFVSAVWYLETACGCSRGRKQAKDRKGHDDAQTALMRIEVTKRPTGNKMVPTEWNGVLFAPAQLSLKQDRKSGECSRFHHPGFRMVQTRSFHPDGKRKANPPCSDCFYLKCLYPADLSLWADSSVIKPSRARLSASSIEEKKMLNKDSN